MIRELLGVAIALVVLSALFGVLQALWPAVRGQLRSRRALRTDLAWWLFVPIVGRPLTKVALGLVLLPMLWLIGHPVVAGQPLQGFGPLATLPIWLQVLLVLVIGDLIGYWQHRAFHGRRLWRFHAVHHGIRELTWLAAVRVHPINDIGAKLAQALPLVLLGFSPTILAAYVPFLTLYAIGLHANLRWDFGPLRLVFASPTFHRWHHARDLQGCNFAGLLPLWDILFGTLYLPRGELPRHFGIQGDPVPEQFFRQLAYPFRRRA